MKKSILFIAVATLGFASCKKDRTCTCTYSSTVPGSVSSQTTETQGHLTKKGGKRVMNCYSYTQTISGTTYTNTAECKLK